MLKTFGGTAVRTAMNMITVPIIEPRAETVVGELLSITDRAETNMFAISEVTPFAKTMVSGLLTVTDGTAMHVLTVTVVGPITILMSVAIISTAGQTVTAVRKHVIVDPVAIVVRTAIDILTGLADTEVSIYGVVDPVAIGVALRRNRVDHTAEFGTADGTVSHAFVAACGDAAGGDFLFGDSLAFGVALLAAGVLYGIGNIATVTLSGFGTIFGTGGIVIGEVVCETMVQSRIQFTFANSADLGIGTGGLRTWGMPLRRLHNGLTVGTDDIIDAARSDDISRNFSLTSNTHLIIHQGDPAAVFAVTNTAVFGITDGDHIAGIQLQEQYFIWPLAGNLCLLHVIEQDI